MKTLASTVLCFIVATGIVGAFVYIPQAPPEAEQRSLAPFKFHRKAAANPEAAARALFQGLSRESPKHFVQHLLLGVCDDSIDTLQKFAESLHRTKFTCNGKSFTFYDLRDLRRGINPKKPVHIIASDPFDTNDKQVAALRSQMISTYYAEKFVAVDLAADGYDGLEYRTRIVAAHVDGGWYAIPRCRSAQSFYKIADAMRLKARDAKGTK